MRTKVALTGRAGMSASGSRDRKAYPVRIVEWIVQRSAGGDGRKAEEGAHVEQDGKDEDGRGTYAWPK